jgi:hypothetical protein
MRILMLVVAAALAGALFPLTAVEASQCNPYPVGFCGESDRQQVEFCYRIVGGRMIDASDRHVVALGTAGGVDLPDNNAKGVIYVRLAPTETFVEDPYESDLPYQTAILETNTKRGAQLHPFKCGQFLWFAECDSWMGPYNIQPQGAPSFQPDIVIA